MLKHFEHIIWDWNGTLLDDAEACISILNNLLARRNMQTIPAQVYRQGFGFPVINFYRQIGFTFEHETYEQVSEEYIKEYLAVSDTLPLRSEAVEILHAFHEAGIRQHVLSALRHDLLEEHIAHRNIRNHFTSVRGLSDLLAVGKTDNGRKLIAEQAMHPARTLFVGDTIHDYEVAQALGIPDCILIQGGHQEPARLQQTGAVVLGTLADLRKWMYAG